MLEQVKWENAEKHHGRQVGNARVDGCAHADDGFKRHAVQVGVQREHNLGIDKNKQYADGDRGDDHRDDSTLLCSIEFVN